jgi:HSP20 family molecular chaperone IbpA
MNACFDGPRLVSSFHQVADNPFEVRWRRHERAPERSSWLPAAEGRLEDGTYIIQLALPGVDPKGGWVSVMDNVLSIRASAKPIDAAGKDYFVREVAYGAFSGTSPFLRAWTRTHWWRSAQRYARG